MCTTVCVCLFLEKVRMTFFRVSPKIGHPEAGIAAHTGGCLRAEERPRS